MRFKLTAIVFVPTPSTSTMVQVLYNGPSSLQASAVDNASKGFAGGSRADSSYHDGKRAPRRSQTHHNYQIPQAPPTMTLHTIRQQPQVAEKNRDGAPLISGEQEQQRRTAVQARQEQAMQRRPPLPPPRRSYSVMDYEPIPHHHRPSTRMTLMDLPGELHFAIFDFLDPIDSTCLGLTNSHFYDIHRRMHGTIPLSARRDGPNELEWAWHLAGAVIQAPPSTLTPDQVAILQSLDDRERSALSKLRVRGQAYCRKCGVTRCELHKHIQDWVGEGREYCSIRQKFGPAALDGAKPYCYLSKPDDPHRCGRHRVHKSKVILQ